MKFTNNAYRLPRAIATDFLQCFDSGSTEPMQIMAVDERTSEKTSFVVKPRGHERNTNVASCKELIGAWIAMEMGIKVFEPALMDITQDFVETLRGNDHFGVFSRSIGTNFATKYVEGAMQLIGLPLEITDQALEIMSFDMSLDNADRGGMKPNLLVVGDQLTVFDHEYCFSFMELFSFARNPTPWDLQGLQLDLLKKHFLYEKLRGRRHNFRPSTEKLELIDDRFWEKVRDVLPVQWLVDEIGHYINYLAQMRNNKAEFAAALTNAMLA